MLKQQYDTLTKQYVTYDIGADTMFSLFAREPLIEFHIPPEVRHHHMWYMYDQFDALQALHADPKSEVYETFDGALYNRKTQALLYVPLGKTSLHIPKHARLIDHRALCRPGLETVTVDPENPHFRIIDGHLYNSRLETLYFVPASCATLSVAASVRYVHPDVFYRSFDEIIVCPGNEVYHTDGGALYRDGRVLTVCPQVRSLHLSARSDLPDARGLNKFPNLQEVTVSDDHPSLRSVGGMLCDKEETTAAFIPTGIRQLHFPDRFESISFSTLLFADNIGFERFSDLEEISVHINTAFNARSFTGVREGCHIFVRLEDGTSIQLPRLSNSGMVGCILFLRGNGAEVKPGTELFYLDYYLTDRDRRPEFLRVMSVSSWQIIRRVIEENHLPRLKAMLADDRLITKKNIGRALKLARQCGNEEILALLLTHKENCK